MKGGNGTLLDALLELVLVPEVGRVFSLTLGVGVWESGSSGF
jgi:hypothetical protein